MNTHVRDNLNQVFPALVTTKGDSVYATGANAGARLPVWANGQIIAAQSACNVGVKYQAGVFIGDYSTSAIPSRANSISIAACGTSPCAAQIVFGDGTGWQLKIGGIYSTGCFLPMLNFIDTGVLWATCAFYVGASTVNACMTKGITIQQGSNTTEILALKNSDVGHGNANTETDTIGNFKVISASGAGGGLILNGYAGSSISAALMLVGNAGLGDTTKSTTATGAVEIVSSRSTANQNLLTLHSTTSVARFIFDNDGDLLADAAITASAYDAFDDAQMVRALEVQRNPAGIVRTEFDNWLKYNRGDLQAAKIAYFNDGPGEDGSVFISYTGLTRLHSGAIWQTYQENVRLRERLERLEYSLTERTGCPFGKIALSGSMML